MKHVLLTGITRSCLPFFFMVAATCFSGQSKADTKGGSRLSKESVKERGKFYTKHVEPILQGACYDCHGEKKQKGGLRLNTFASIRKGGKNGPVVVPENPDESHLYSLITLPSDDPDLMPAKGDPLTQVQTELLKQWIQDGAYFPDGSTADKLAYMTDTLLDQQFVDLPPPDATVVDALKNQAVIVRPLTKNGALLELDFSHSELKNGPLNLSQCTAISANIGYLDLAKIDVTNEELTTLATFKNLSRLHLERSDIGDIGLVHLKNLTQLEYLNLCNTQVTDKGLEHIKALKSLKNLYLWKSQVTLEGVEMIRRELPKTYISFEDLNDL